MVNFESPITLNQLLQAYRFGKVKIEDLQNLSLWETLDYEMQDYKEDTISVRGIERRIEKITGERVVFEDMLDIIILAM